MRGREVGPTFHVETSSAKAMQARSAGAVRMADLRAEIGTERSDLAYLMREFRRISNRISDDLAEID